MSKSHHRRNGRTRRTARPNPRAQSDHRDELRANAPWINRMFEVDAVEARGDAAGALRLVESMPLGPDGRPWWRPWRIRRLHQIADLGDSTPGWVWAKWAVSQAAQSTPGDHARALREAIATRGGRSTLWGVDQADAQAKVMDHDWVYRQLVLHEYGGLRTFLDQRAGQDLVSRAVGIDTWTSAPMRALQLAGEEPTRIQWLDLATLEVVETINLGAAAMLADGECVIGRVVESDGTLLFDSAPLCVPPDVARRVAADPNAWLRVLADACRDTTGPILGRLVARFHEFDLLCDLPSSVRRQVIQPEDPDLGSDQIGTGGNGEEYDVALVLAALADEIDVLGDDDAPCDCGEDHETSRPLASLVAAALVEPGTVEALRPLLVPSDGRALMNLARVLPEPADQVCRRLANQVADAA